VSVSEPNLDYSTPQGFLFLSMLGAPLPSYLDGHPLLPTRGHSLAGAI